MISIQLEQEPRYGRSYKVPDEGELVVDMFHHQQQVDGEAYRPLVAGRERGACPLSPMTDGWHWNWLAHSNAT